MARPLNIAVLQFQSEAATHAPNRRQIVLDSLRHQLQSLAGRQLDLLVTSEGIAALAQSPAEAEALDQPGEVLSLYQQFARAQRCVVAGSVKTRRQGKVYNSVVFIERDGSILDSYDKTYLTLGELEEGLHPGRGAVVVDSSAGRLGGVICYDLNFVDLCEAYAALKPDVLAFASMYHGGLMQSHWAYRCRAFLAAALPFTGGGIVDPLGRLIHPTHEYRPHIFATLQLDRVLVHLDYHREKFDDILRHLGAAVTVDIPAHIGSALITSLSPQRTAADIVRQWQLEPLDDYLHRAARANHALRQEPLP